MGWLRLVGSVKLYLSFAKEPYKRDYENMRSKQEFGQTNLNLDKQISY